MWRALRRPRHLLSLLGAMALSATSAGGEAVKERALQFACVTSANIDPARLSDICSGFLDVLGSEPGFRLLGSQGTSLAHGPGLEVDVIRATDTQLELVATWIDASGQRTAMPSSGLVIMDTTMTQTMRRDFFRQILANPPS